MTSLMEPPTTPAAPTDLPKIEEDFVSPDASAETLRARRNEYYMKMEELNRVLSLFENTQRDESNPPAQSNDTNISADTLARAVNIPFEDSNLGSTLPEFHNPLGFAPSVVSFDKSPQWITREAFSRQPRSTGSHLSSSGLTLDSHILKSEDSKSKSKSNGKIMASNHISLSDSESSSQKSKSKNDNQIIASKYISLSDSESAPRTHKSDYTHESASRTYKSEYTYESVSRSHKSEYTHESNETSNPTLGSSFLSAEDRMHLVNLANIPSMRVQTESNDGECSICIEEMCLGERKRILTCGHQFHATCVQLWLKNHVGCPLCRREQPLHRDSDDESNFV